MLLIRLKFELELQHASYQIAQLAYRYRGERFNDYSHILSAILATTIEY